MATYLITGGCGFIGSNYVRHLLAADPDARVVNLDKLTYAGRRENLADWEADDRYAFVEGDICDGGLVEGLFAEHAPDVVVNFAAESHVDRSIMDPDAFIRTDVYGVYVLCETARRHGVERFLQVSTDEVYGSIDQGLFRETDPLMPSSPYAASKAGGDRLAYSYWVTYGLPVLVTRASNNFGPYQYPEKLIPLFVTNAMEDQPLPLYGDGKNVRDWLYVRDHCTAIDAVLDRGAPGEAYNVGGGNERQNIAITETILELLGKPKSLIQPVADRAGHDRRYALASEKLEALGWSADTPFDDALAETVAWYRDNRTWWEPIKSGEFKEFYRRQYEERG